MYFRIHITQALKSSEASTTDIHLIGSRPFVGHFHVSQKGVKPTLFFFSFYLPADVFCWISNGKALLVVFGVPVALILMFNFVALCLTMVSIWKVQKVLSFASFFPSFSLAQGLPHDLQLTAH